MLGVSGEGRCWDGDLTAAPLLPLLRLPPRRLQQPPRGQATLFQKAEMQKLVPVASVTPPIAPEGGFYVLLCRSRALLLLTRVPRGFYPSSCWLLRALYIGRTLPVTRCSDVSRCVALYLNSVHVHAAAEFALRSVSGSNIHMCT